MRNYFISTLSLLTLLTSFSLAAAGTPSMTVGTFPQEVRREFTVADGLPVNAIKIGRASCRERVCLYV